jgi:transcriptional regulator with XRE-family HTH domain
MMRDHAGGERGDVSTAAMLALANKPAEELTFGDRLNLLWTAVRPTRDEDPQAWRVAKTAWPRGGKKDDDAQGRPQYTNTWVAHQLEKRYGVRVTPSYLGKLRHGDKPNPGLPVLHALAQFFKVDTAFLLPVTTDADREKIAGVRDDLINWLAQIGSAKTTDSAGGVSIELRLTGVTTAEEAQRQVAVALAQWLEDQRGQSNDDGESGTEHS